MSRYTPISQDTIDAIKALGFDVYMTSDQNWRTYLFFTDGKNIGCMQRTPFGQFTLSTVHIPNRSTGTGFDLTDDSEAISVDQFTVETLSKAFATAPTWASHSDRQSVRKYADFESFAKSRSHSKLVKV